MHLNQMISPTIAYEMIAQGAYSHADALQMVQAGSTGTTKTPTLTATKTGTMQIATTGNGGATTPPITDPVAPPPPTGGTKSNGYPSTPPISTEGGKPPKGSGVPLPPDVGGAEQKPAPTVKKELNWLPIIMGITGLYVVIAQPLK